MNNKIEGKYLLSSFIWILPILPVMFFLIHSFYTFSQLILTKDVMFLFGAYLSISILLFFILRRLFRQERDSALFLSTTLITSFLSFGIFQDFFYSISGLKILGNSILLIFILIGSVFLVFFMARKRNLIRKTNAYLLFFFLISILIDTGRICFVFNKGKDINTISHQMKEKIFPDNIISEKNDPDIYHIIFDSYTNSATLKQYWQFDNPIYPFLQSKGFFTSDSAFSGYISTPYSVSSLFNLQYLKGAEPFLYSNSSNFMVGKKVYDENELFRLLHKKKYTFSIFSQLENSELLTGFGTLGVSKPNIWIRNQTMERLLISPWIQLQINKMFGNKEVMPSSLKNSMNAFFTYNMKALEHIRKSCSEVKDNPRKQPIFSYTHFMIPHDPYIIDENGNRIKDPKPDNSNMDGYLTQVKYCNKVMEEITNCLLGDTSRKKIIIFHGDHGYRHYSGGNKTDQFGTLYAIYFSDENYSGFGKKEALVNMYRKIANKYFGTQLKELGPAYYRAEKKDNVN